MLDAALLYSQIESWAEAAAAWRALLDDPGELSVHVQAQAHCALGDSLQRLGRDELAADAFASAVRLAPAFPGAALRLAAALRRLGRPSAAEAAYRQTLRRSHGRRTASRAEVAAAVSGAAVAMLRLGRPSRARRLLRAWHGVDRGEGREAMAVTLLAVVMWLLKDRCCPSGTAVVHQEAQSLLQEASKSASASLGPLCRQLLHNHAQACAPELLNASAQSDAYEVVDLDDTMTVLGLAAANRSALDAPQLDLLDDKCKLHMLLCAFEDFRRLRFYWPMSFVMPDERAASYAAAMPLEGGRHSNTPGWWLKAAHGHGGHQNQLLSPVEVTQTLTSETPRCLLQRDVSGCILLDDRRFTLRLYLVLVGGAPWRAYLATKGLVYRALDGSMATNCSQAALQLRGSASAAGAPAAPDLEWLRGALAAYSGSSGRPELGPMAFEVLWRRLRRLAALLVQGAIAAALAQPVAEVPNASFLAELGIPKILGLDVIVAGASPGGRVGPWPWLLEVNRFPALGFRAPSDATVKLPVVRDAWKLAAKARTKTEALPSVLGCLEELPRRGERRGARRSRHATM